MQDLQRASGGAYRLASAWSDGPLAAEKVRNRAICCTEVSNFTRLSALLGENQTVDLFKLNSLSSRMLAFVLVQGKAGGDVTIRRPLVSASDEFHRSCQSSGEPTKNCPTAHFDHAYRAYIQDTLLDDAGALDSQSGSHMFGVVCVV